MGGGDGVRPRMMHARMNGKGRLIHRVLPFNHIALVITADEVRDADLAEVNAKTVQPESVGELRIARGDVSGDALIEPELREQTKCRSQPLFAMQALLTHGGKGWRLWQCLAPAHLQRRVNSLLHRSIHDFLS